LDSFLRLTGIKSLAFLLPHCPIFSIIHSRLAFGKIFKITGGYWKSGTSFLKRELLEGFSQLVSGFIERNKNFILDFINKKQPKILRNSFKKYCLDFYDSIPLTVVKCICRLKLI
jgi:hypothetical protein